MGIIEVDELEAVAPLLVKVFLQLKYTICYHWRAGIMPQLSSLKGALNALRITSKKFLIPLYVQ